MKTWSIIFNFIAIAILCVMLRTFYIQIDAWDSDFETARLGYQSDYCAEAAFIKSMTGGNLGIDYQDLNSPELSPEKSLDAFRTVMCFGYEKTPNEENKSQVNDLIETSVLACSDGYYISPIKMSKFGKVDITYDWTSKIPYVLTTEQMTEQIKAPIVRACEMERGNIKAGLFTFKGNRVYLLGDDESMKFEAVGSVNFSTAARNTILQKINAQINTDIIDNISNVYATSESKSHRVYLPYSQTDDGINSLTGPSFIAIVSGRGFTTNGFINKTVMSGYKTVRKMYVVGYSYRNKNGGDMSGAVQKRYCYETQLPKNYENGTETRGPITVDKFYTSIEKAAEDGYYPDLEYLQHRIDYDAKH